MRGGALISAAASNRRHCCRRAAARARHAAHAPHRRSPLAARTSPSAIWRRFDANDVRHHREAACDVTHATEVVERAAREPPRAPHARRRSPAPSRPSRRVPALFEDGRCLRSTEVELAARCRPIRGSAAPARIRATTAVALATLAAPRRRAPGAHRPSLVGVPHAFEGVLRAALGGEATDRRTEDVAGEEGEGTRAAAAGGVPARASAAADVSFGGAPPSPSARRSRSSVARASQAANTITVARRIVNGVPPPAAATATLERAASPPPADHRDGDERHARRPAARRWPAARRAPRGAAQTRPRAPCAAAVQCSRRWRAPARIAREQRAQPPVACSARRAEGLAARRRPLAHTTEQSHRRAAAPRQPQ